MASMFVVLSGWNLFVVTFLLNTDVCQGIANTTIDCTSGGRPGESTTINCKITGTIVSGIRWIRPNDGSPQQVIICNTANTICDPSGGITGYSSLVISPTQNVLAIQSFNTTTDVGEWSCLDGPTGAGSFVCNMTVKSPKPCDWCIGLSVVISILIAVGIGLIIGIFLVSGAFLKKIIVAVGGILLIMAIVVAVLLGIQTDADLGTGAYLAAAVLCGFGFVVGIILVAVGVWQIHKT
ncbi:uncharacterized protein LOC121367015, partial [Gigantopelta aegis]|uniref:uncharacterized protein LOC121367015 n=1 Tax=Gigantopelta aegis TaxID=1735272 RepID=UPI001B88C79F